MADNKIGGPSDQVTLKLADKIVVVAESYEVHCSIIQQPAAFTLRLGWSVTVADLMESCPPGTKFELSINDRIVQTGRVDSIGTPSSAFTQLEIKGRDYLATVFDSYAGEELTFPEKTFFQLTRRVLDLCGLNDFELLGDNDANRALITGVPVKPNSPGEVVSQIRTAADTGTGGLVTQAPKMRLGTRFYDFLQQQYKLAGLFLWATPDKKFILARPRADQVAAYRLFRARGKFSTADETGNVLDCRFHNDTTMRHTLAVVYGRTGGGKNAIEKCRGEFLDPEVHTLYGDPPVFKNIVIHDADVTDRQQCEYVARRILSDERRAGWQLEYTVAGHSIPSSRSSSGVAIWGPDTVCRIEDEELDSQFGVLKTDYYLESVTFARNPQTTTKLIFMRKGDLLFAHSISGEDDTEPIVRKEKAPKGKTTR